MLPKPKHKGEKNVESALANSVCFMVLKKPTYLNSPIARKIKMEGIDQ